ncbi:hypothetical protein BS47DRAFT_1354393 [Hydnum rufescens UP504]|uniref:Uncharacterized protein n=1 Tax=Hydnum rufescens UP504 TaxID=1448309 RepID=A0A9P6DI22_9AGAM|nr:hypothetical protein BS47DRAFT_1354393 [Hydnum rufescens UP504]
MWTRHLLAFFTLRKPREVKSDVLPQLPTGISTSAIVSVENALREIPIGISGARTGIRAFLGTVKEINVTAATDERTLRHLESDIRLLAEVLEPLGYTESHLFSPELLHQLRRLGRKLQDTSSTMKQSISHSENRHGLFSSQRENTGGDLNLFAEGFHLVLDEFRVCLSRIGVVSTCFPICIIPPFPLTLGDCTANVFSEHDGGGGAPIGYCIKLVMCPTSLFGLGRTIETSHGSPLRTHPNCAHVL